MALLRKSFFLVVACLFCFSGVCQAKRLDILILLSSKNENYDNLVRGLGAYLQSKDVSFSFSEYNLSETNTEKILPEIARKPDIVLTLGSKALEFACKNVNGIPVVFSFVFSDPQLVATCPNITGVSLDIPVEEKIQVIKKVVPHIKRLGLFYSEKSRAEYENIAKGCEKASIRVTAKKINNPNAFAASIEDMSTLADAFIVVPDTDLYFIQSMKHLFMVSLKYNLPVIGLSKYFTKAGALFSIEPEYHTMNAQVYQLIFRIVSGEKAFNIPVQNAEKMSYSLNISVAERLGIGIDPSVKTGADEVFGR